MGPGRHDLDQVLYAARSGHGKDDNQDDPVHGGAPQYSAETAPEGSRECGLAGVRYIAPHMDGWDPCDEADIQSGSTGTTCKDGCIPHGSGTPRRQTTSGNAVERGDLETCPKWC